MCPPAQFLASSVRMTAEKAATREEGNQIHQNSLLITIKPQLPMKAAMPIGETMMGLHGKKYLPLSKGDNKAMPRPPLVKASRTPWLAVKREKYRE